MMPGISSRGIPHYVVRFALSILVLCSFIDKLHCDASARNDYDWRFDPGYNEALVDTQQEFRNALMDPDINLITFTGPVIVEPSWGYPNDKLMVVYVKRNVTFTGSSRHASGDGKDVYLQLPLESQNMLPVVHFDPDLFVAFRCAVR